MSGTGSGYDLSVTTYSPDGKMFQVEYAQKAVENAGTAVGVRCIDGVILGVEKLVISKMLVPGSNRRLHAVDDHIGVAVTGLAGDCRMLVNRARDECRAYRQNFGEPISGRLLAERIAGYLHLFTSYWYYRPVGATMMIASYDKEEKVHELYMAEPNGELARYFGVASGKGTRSAKTEIEKLKVSDKPCREALGLIAKILHVVHDLGKDKPFELELSWVCEETGWKHERVPDAVRDEADEWAKKTLEEEEMGSSDEDDDESD